MENNIKEIIEKFIEKHELSLQEYVTLIDHYKDAEVVAALKDEAVRLRDKATGNVIYTRGLIEFTNYCRNDCYYCGIRCSNKNANRYRLTKEEILSCCEEGYRLGFRTFVLQGGEDMSYSDQDMVEIISEIKARFKDAYLTLSIGERSYESYEKYRKAGADRYLLRHETADEEHYRKLHPENLSLSNRKRCLMDLKSLGYAVGAGFMVGSPYQTHRNIAEDLVYLQELKPEMVGMGPFIPHSDTIFKDEMAGELELTLFLLSVIRIMLPKVFLPATTALGTISPNGRELGLLSGANVVMPNLSPTKNRKDYSLYDNKICTGDESAQCVRCLENRVSKYGFTLDATANQMAL